MQFSYTDNELKIQNLIRPIYLNSLNMVHDDDVKCNRFKKNGVEPRNIMARMLGADVHPWSWSTCSRHYITEFLE